MPRLVALWVLTSMLALPAAGFASVPPEDIHAAITQNAAEQASWPVGGRDALVDAVRAVDVDEMEWDPDAGDPVGIRMNEAYKAAHHCDRLVPMDNATALQATVAYIQERRDAAISSTDAAEATRAAGQALHALQDCFSHSDYVDLSPVDQERFRRALLGEGAPPPARLVATSDDHDPPGLPPDPYPHDRFAKDTPEQNEEAQERLPDGSTKHEAARGAATNVSAVFLQRVLAEMEPSARDGLDGLDGMRRWVPTVPAPPVTFVVLALMVGVVGARVARSRS